MKHWKRSESWNLSEILIIQQVINDPEGIRNTIVLFITNDKFDSVFNVLPQGYQVPAQ